PFLMDCPALLAKLPLARHADQISKALLQERNLLLMAPTGTGKSSFLPWFLHSQGDLRIAMLQPRRIAALSLCGFLAKALGEEPGALVGYSFRFETKKSAVTHILFQTYGSFLQGVLSGKGDRFDWILFDEFHERRTDMDLLLSWCLAWQKAAPQNAPRIAVLSADLQRQELETLLGVPCLEIQSPGFPVQTLHQEPKLSESLDRQVLRALRTLQGNGIWNTTLVFLPGKSEIQSCAHLLEDELRGLQAPEILRLFGGQDGVEQARIFADTEAPRVILTTNIAETSLTVPQVTAVVDSGLERNAEFDATRNIPVLRLGRIALQNAVQRMGRAGRTRAGVCVRLWSERDQVNLAANIQPEILRCRLDIPLLQHAALASRLTLPSDALRWPTPPPKELSQKNQQELNALGFLDGEGNITPSGLSALQIPVQSLEVTRLLLSTQDRNEALLACAAWLDAGSESLFLRSGESQNLLDLARDLLMDRRGLSRDIALQYQQIRRWAESQGKIAAWPQNLHTTLR
ncbi:MAG TPA: helicase-related protein, partial [Fibrobacteraceae bacterium]|nr:helicase-related protein [Fibrobacteraceae bacterium]